MGESYYRLPEDEEKLGETIVTSPIVVTQRGSRIIDAVVKRCYNIAHSDDALLSVLQVNGIDEATMTPKLTTVSELLNNLEPLIVDCVIEPLEIASAGGGSLDGLIILADFVSRLGLGVDVRQVSLRDAVEAYLNHCIKPPQDESDKWSKHEYAIDYALERIPKCVRELIITALDTLERSETTQVLIH